ncbi:MAG: elongation factor Ts [Candidatus Melainabacteria bacterium]|nr:MAG: elongation factor Ts [Candidatus Melainabacteria bacterium]
MVEISASMVKELREKSGAAMMDCKKALVEAAGDFEKAFEWLRQKGVAMASKKSARTAAEGLIVGQVSQDGKKGVLLEINCETDFVARNEQFVELTKQISDAALQSQPKSVEELLKAKAPGGTVEALVTEAIAKTGENIVVRRLASFQLGSKNGLIGLYVHALGGKMGAIIEVEASGPVAAEKLGNAVRELAMHIVFAKPQYLERSQVPNEIVENERRIESGKADLADKKPEIREKIVSGRVDKIFAERCLMDQPFVRDSAITAGKFLSQKGSELGITLKPTHYALFILGEVAESSNGSGG